MPRVEIFSTNKFATSLPGSHQKISILGSISAENEDKRSMKITQIGYYVTCYEISNMQDSTYLIFVHHEGEPIRVFYSIKISKCNYRDSSQIYKQHFNRFINIFKHCCPPYCVHNISCPNTCSVASFAKIEIPGGLPTFCTVTCGLLRYYITHPITFLCQE